MLESPIRLLVSHTENICEAGVRVILEEKLKAFITVGVEVYLEKTQPVKCKGKVVWAMEKVNPLETQATRYDIGVEFTDISTADKESIRNLVNTINAGGAAGK
jgi:Tfp pilus assembly protein PilZ